jgi:hypothetical protein
VVEKDAVKGLEGTLSVVILVVCSITVNWLFRRRTTQ